MYDIPIETVFTKGPYMHSIEGNYRQATTSFQGVQQDQIRHLTNQLKSKLEFIKAEEQKFYDLFEVNDALEFSNTYLWGKSNKVETPQTISQKLLSILNNPEVFALLTQLDDKDSVQLEQSLRQTALKFLKDNPKIVQNSIEIGENQALRVILDYLNQAKGSKSVKVIVDGKESEFAAPQGTLTSEHSKYITDILKTINPEIALLRRGNITSRIKKVIEYFRLKGAELLGDDLEEYALLLEEKLYAAMKARDTNDFLDESNISMFTNFFGAEGAIFEMVLGMSLQPSSEVVSDQRTKNVLLANAVVQGIRQRYDFAEGGGIYNVTTKSGKYWKMVYKSPTDLLIFDPVTKQQYPIQLKNTLHNIGLDTTLTLQNSIALPSFLANVSNITSTQINNLLIYHIVNQSNFPGGSGLNYITNILNACIEYYVESKYVERVAMPAVNVLDTQIDTNMGNMFMIYSGTLVPISAFIENAIYAIEGDSTLISSSKEGMFSYGLRIPVEQIKGKEFDDRIAYGKAVYEAAKVTQIQVAIGKIVDYINNMSV